MGRPSQGRKSSSSCPTISIVVFVFLGLIGVWMLMSSSAQSIDSSESVSQSTSYSKHHASGRFPKVFEDNQGDLPDDAIAGNDKSLESTDEPEVKVDQEENEEEKKEEDNGDDKRTSEDSSEDNTESESEEKSEPEIEEKVSSESKSESEDEEANSGEAKSDGESESDDGSTEKQEMPAAAESELGKEEPDGTGTGSWATQADESENEIESQRKDISVITHKWKLCNVTAGNDYIPCLDNWEAIKQLHGRNHFEHRERHCPKTPPSCLVPVPKGYRRSIEWPKSREKVWFRNVPNTKLAEVKGHQNWVKVSGDYLTFPGGGTQFIHGALHYIDFIQSTLPDIAWGKRTRVILDVGCGVASFGGFLFDRNTLAMSLAPKDEHEAQVQFALERGIPAILAVMGTRRLPFPGSVFDVVHCARCRVPWHIEGGKLLLELNRLLRPGGYFVWSATPIYQTLPEDVAIWKAMKKLMKSMCWETIAIKKDKLNAVAVAIFKKPVTNDCYEKRTTNEPPMCEESDNPNAAWNVKLEACMHPVTTKESARGSRWPEMWPKRLVTPPYWLKSETGVYGKDAAADFAADYKHWKNVVQNSYMSGMGFNLSTVRSVMDMRAVYGGFAAALKELPVWVMNVVPIDSADTLPVIYERGLFGMYHDWCESFNSYPRTYDLLHADRLFSSVKQRCQLVPVMAEVDRLLRPEGKLIVRDDVEVINEVESIARSMHWEIRLIYNKDGDGLLCVRKTKWRPKEIETVWASVM